MTAPVTSPRSQASASRWQRAAPIVTLLLLAPVIVDLLFGATRITTLPVLIPQIGFWGCAALLIREVVRRRRQSWPAILLLGLALAVAEECLVVQTSLAPLVGVDPDRIYSRVLGVNWIYFLWALGYESVWAIVIPIQLTELIFPEQRDSPWLGKPGLAISVVILAAAAFITGYSWTQIFVPQYFPESAYQVPMPAVLVALAVIVVLAAAAYRLRPSSDPAPIPARLRPLPAWQVGLAALMLGLPWFGLVLLAYGILPTLPPAIPFVLGLVVAGTAFFLINDWSSSPAWGDASRLALIFGALSASMLGGAAILTLGLALPVDRIGQLVLNGIAALLLIGLARKIQSRQRQP